MSDSGSRISIWGDYVNDAVDCHCSDGNTAPVVQHLKNYLKGFNRGLMCLGKLKGTHS